MTPENGRRVFAVGLVNAAIAVSVATAQTPAPSPAAPTASPAVTADAPVIKITPYGTVFMNAFSNSSATNNADIPLWAVAGPKNTSATVRGSRFGLKIAGASVGSAKLSG